MKKIILAVAMLLAAQGAMAADMRVETIKQTVPEIKGEVEVQAGCFKVTAPGQTGFYINKIQLYSPKDPGQYFSSIKLVSNLNGKQVILGELAGTDADKIKDNDFRLNFPKMSLPVARGQYKNVCIIVKGLPNVTSDTEFSFTVLKNGLRSIDAKKKSAYSSKQLSFIKIKVKAVKASIQPSNGSTSTSTPSAAPFYTLNSDIKINHNLAVSDTADATIQIQLSPKGGDIYIPTSGAVLARGMRNDFTETTSTFSYTVNADLQGSNYIIRNGDTKYISVAMHIEPNNTGYFYGEVYSIGWKNTPESATLNLMDYPDIGQQYRTATVYLIKR
ncbi:MAG: hypothetical protein WC449_01125 [Candidatus Paceibacterota bacterium]